VSVAYSSAINSGAQIRAWVQQYKNSLIDITNLLRCHREKPPAYSLVPPTVKETIFSTLNSSSCSPQVGNIVNVLPVTYVQQNYITQGIKMPRLAFNYLHIDLGPLIDPGLLEASCRMLVNHFSILRVRFIYCEGRWWQIVFDNVELAFSTFEAKGPLLEEAYNFSVRDSERIDPLGFPTSFSLIRTKSNKSRLIIRLSHAQYDGVSIPFILETLASIYHQEPLRPAVDFSVYLADAHNRRSESIRYWRRLLRGSNLNRITTCLQPEASDGALPCAVTATRSIHVPPLPEHLTMASFISSAWAVLLSRITGTEDVVYGQVVTGRNSNVLDIMEITGPCVNITPVRVLILPNKIAEEIVLDVQEQYISLGQSDSVGWDEIVQQCTDWTSGSALDSVVLHQNISVEPEICIAGVTGKAKWFDHPSQVAHHVLVHSQTEGDKLRIAIAGNTHIMRAGVAEPLLGMLVETITALSNGLQKPLASCKSSQPVFT
jgi:hypothetical protein